MSKRKLFLNILVGMVAVKLLMLTEGKTKENLVFEKQHGRSLVTCKGV